MNQNWFAYRDKKDRKVSVVKGKGWKFQMDNELPIDLKIGDVFEIKKNVFHRLHQGKDRLILHIKEYDEVKNYIDQRG